MYRTILLPYDGSPLSESALPVATELARRAAATVHLVLVHDPASYIPFVAGEVAIPLVDQTLEHEARERDRRQLDAAVDTLRAGGLAVVGALLEGSVADTLERYIEQVTPDLVVMTTHGRGGFQRMRLGSVATALLTRITCPILLLRAEEDGQVPNFPQGPVLCAMDGSAFGEAVLPHARTFASLCGQPLHLAGISVPHVVPLAPFGTETLLVDHEAQVVELEHRQRYLAELASRMGPDTTHATGEHLSASRGVLDEVARRGAGAIAMATHGRGGLARLVLGSTTDEVVRHAHVPVLVYRPPTPEQ